MNQAAAAAAAAAATAAVDAAAADLQTELQISRQHSRSCSKVLFLKKVHLLHILSFPQHLVGDELKGRLKHLRTIF